MTLLLCTAFFLSGASALIFETLWFSQTGLVLGNSVWASSLVLSGFMCGLALGNAIAARWGDRLRNPVYAYAILEITVAASGVGLVFLLPSMSEILAPLLRPFQDLPVVLNGIRLAVAFGFLMIPSTAMGLTLPLLTKALLGFEFSFGRVLGNLYGWNTFGAVAGALACECLLVGTLGVRGSALAAGAMNLFAAATAMGCGRRVGRLLPAPVNLPKGQKTEKSVQVLYGASFLSGFILLALEVVWFRFLLLFVLSLSLSFAVMLSIVLTGIALGGVLASRWFAPGREAYRSAPLIAFAAGLLSVVSYRWFPLLGYPSLTSAWNSSAEVALPIIKAGIPLMLPVSLLSGILFTLIGAALKAHIPSATCTVGFLTLANTLGAATGALVAGFLFLPRLGMEASLFLLASLYGLVGLVLQKQLKASRKAFWGGLAVFSLSLALFPFGAMYEKHLAVSAARWTQPDKGSLIAVSEGAIETVMLIDRRRIDAHHYYRLVTNAYSMTGTSVPARKYMKLFVYLPFALQENPKSALLISYGVGSTAKAMTDSREWESIDIVDISREILDVSELIYADARPSPLSDPRVRVHIEDGRHFLQMTDRAYDLITGEPPPPNMAGVANLYTREYFRLVRNRLKEGGMVTYWLPLHSLSDSGAKSILHAFCDVFPNASLWHGAGNDLILLGSRGEMPPVSWDHYSRIWRDPTIAGELTSLGLEHPEQLGALYIDDGSHLGDAVSSAKSVVDDFPKRILAPFTTQVRPLPLFLEWFEPSRAQDRFVRSAWIARTLPSEAVHGAIPYFDAQGIISRLEMTWLGHDFVHLEELHWILGKTDLRAPALWLMKSDEDLQRVVALADAPTRMRADYQYHTAVGFIADRRYAESLDHLRAAEADPLSGIWARALRIYLLLEENQPDEARTVACSPLGGGGENRPLPPGFGTWMEATFGIDPLAPPTALGSGL